jgi:hypothetical protein
MTGLPFCAFEQHLGARRAVADFDGAIVDGPNRRVISTGSVRLAEVGLLDLLGLEKGWFGLKVSRLETLDPHILRSAQNRAVLVAMASEGTHDNNGNAILDDNALVAARLLPGEVRTKPSAPKSMFQTADS